MKSIFTLIVFMSAAVMNAADKANTTTVSASGGAKFEITAPDGWTIKTVSADPSIPAATSLASPDGDANLLISFIPDKDGAFATREKLEAVLNKTAKQYEGGSVEKKTKIEMLDSKNGLCVFAEFTDSDLVGKKTEAGQFKVVGTGLMLFDKTVATLTLLGGSFTDKPYIAGKEAIKTGIRLKK